MYTLTTLQCKSYHYYGSSCTYRMFYGPVFLPDLDYILSQTKDTEAKSYIESAAHKYHFVNADNLKDLVPNCIKLFEENKEFFLSGKGLERSYIEFSVPKKRIVKRLMTNSTFKVVVLNSPSSSIYIYRAEAAKSIISINIRKCKEEGFFQPYVPTTLQPEEILDFIMTVLDKKSNIMAHTRVLILLSLLRYREIKKKLTMK